MFSTLKKGRQVKGEESFYSHSINSNTSDLK